MKLSEADELLEGLKNDGRRTITVILILLCGVFVVALVAGLGSRLSNF